jgi:hypothetical protein
MKPAPLIPIDHKHRLQEIVDQSWRIFQSQFIGNRHPISKEAPFQHHFANILSNVGQLYCTSRDDVFLVDLETKVEGVRGRNKYLDITCSFPNSNISCAIELKFKTARQGAQDHGRIDAYSDIEALEIVTETEFSFGMFYMITDSPTYLHKSKRGVGTIFCMHDGFLAPSGKPLSGSNSKGREDVEVTFRNEHILKWENAGEWYFLAIPVFSPKP